jgi:hypothetical protein
MMGNNKAKGNFNQAVDGVFSNNNKQYITVAIAVIDNAIRARKEIKINGVL